MQNRKKGNGIKDKRSSNTPNVTSLPSITENTTLKPSQRLRQGKPPPSPANYLSDLTLLIICTSPSSFHLTVPFESSSRPISSPPPEGVRSLWSGNYQPARWSLDSRRPLSLSNRSNHFRSIDLSVPYPRPIIVIQVEWISFFLFSSSSFLNDSI